MIKYFEEKTALYMTVCT